MGVLFDYFRAANADAAAVADGPEWAGPLVPPDDGQQVFDAVDAKGIDPPVNLGKLLAIAQDVPWSAVHVIGAEVRPALGGEADYVEHGLHELTDEARDVLAGIAREQIPNLAGRWALIEEFGGGWNPDDLGRIVGELVALAQRAQAAREHLYCWWSL